MANLTVTYLRGNRVRIEAPRKHPEQGSQYPMLKRLVDKLARRGAIIHRLGIGHIVEVTIPDGVPQEWVDKGSWEIRA